MDDVEAQPLQSHINHHQIVDFLWVDGVYSLVMVFWLIFLKDHPVCYFFWAANVCVFGVLLSAIRIDIWGTLVNLWFIFEAYMAYLVFNHNFAHGMYVLRLTVLIFGGVLAILVVCDMIEKHYGHQETVDAHDLILKNLLFMGLMNTSCVCFLNVFANLCYSWVKWGSRGWKILGIVLLGVLGFLTAVCCILRMVSRWQEYCKSRARVTPIQDSSNQVM